MMWSSLSLFFCGGGLSPLALMFDGFRQHWTFLEQIDRSKMLTGQHKNVDFKVNIKMLTLKSTFFHFDFKGNIFWN